jgi:hypothetical protein
MGPTENTAPESGADSENGITDGAATFALNAVNRCSSATILVLWPRAADGTRIASLL